MKLPPFRHKGVTSTHAASMPLRFGVVLLLGMLAACGSGVQVSAPVSSGPTIPPPQSDTCQATPYARLIGQDATALERELILRQVRLIRPGDAVTQDFRPVRLNFEIGPDNRILRIFCG